jgi:hypothetical protein
MVSFLAGYGNHLSTPLKYAETPRPRSSCYICPSQDNSAPPLDPSSLPDHIDTIPGFTEALLRAKLHPLDILPHSHAIPLSFFSLTRPPTAIGRYPAYRLSPRLATQALDTLYTLDPFVLGSLIPDDGGSTHLWNVGRQSFYTAVYPRRQLWTSYSPPWELERFSYMLALLQ